MLFFYRILPIFASAWLALGDLLAIRHPSAFWVFAGLAAIGPFVALWLFVRKSSLPHGFGSILFFPVYTLLPAIGCLLFSEHIAVQIVFAVGLAILFGFQLEQAFRYRFQPARYQPNALVNASVAFALVGPFFLTLTLFDLQIFASVPLWLVVAIHAATTLLWFIALLRLLPIPLDRAWWWGIVACTTLVEIFAVLAWLPALPTVKATIYALIATVVVQRYRSDATNDPSSHKWSFVLLGVMLLLLVAFAHWFA